MKGKRTGLDFSKHIVTVIEQEGLLVHYLHKPNTVIDAIKYINTNGILAVTGDYGNWIFCREFHPSEKGDASDSYWVGKLINSSCQKPSEFDSKETEKEINRLLAESEDLTEEETEYLNGCLRDVDDELDYTYHAYREAKGRFSDLERVPFEKKLHVQLPFIFDGFDEICQRLKEKENCNLTEPENAKN